jgi:single-strand DNA-binding protein
VTETQTKDQADIEGAVNEVRLVGRLTAAPQVTELPSGDAVVSFSISIPRIPAPGAVVRPQAQRVDPVPCAAWSPRLRRGIMTWRAGDVVEVTGAVRRRFFQAGGATRSRVEVEAATAKIIRRSSAA